MKKRLVILTLLAFLLSSSITATYIWPAASNPLYKSDYKNALKKVADRLVALQSPTDFGWD